MLLVASYIFYAAWDWRFLSLIWISTITDYLCGLKIAQVKQQRKKKKILFISVFINLAILGFFKYFNFFISNFHILLEQVGWEVPAHFLNIVLPIGISFYTFQTLSYTIDVYYEKIQPTARFFDFALFVAFFPQLVAGPIERAKNLLPQILEKRHLSLEQFYEGCYLIFWGIFQKVFIADNLSKIVNPIFAMDPPYESIKVLIAVYAFAFQIFCDFAGYSNIARGISKCMGFDLMINFNLPYFSTSPSEFWQRWHISLSSWLKDYLYIPLGGNRKGSLKTYRNLAVTMLLGGLWHGAAWNFVFWGFYQGVLLIIYRIFSPLGQKICIENKIIKNIGLLLNIIFFFHLTCLGWLIFRAQSLNQIVQMLSSFFSPHQHFFFLRYVIYILKLSPYLLILIVVQILQYKTNDLLVVYKFRIIPKSLFYYVCIITIILCGVTGAKEFIYFQF